MLSEPGTGCPMHLVSPDEDVLGVDTDEMCSGPCLPRYVPRPKTVGRCESLPEPEARYLVQPTAVSGLVPSTAITRRGIACLATLFLVLASVVVSTRRISY